MEPVGKQSYSNSKVVSLLASAGTAADDNTDSAMAYDVWLNDSSSAEN